MNATHELVFETPPRNEGQIVEYSYATTKSGAVIEQRHDGSDGSLHFSWRRSGRRLTEAELARHGLVERG
jgi:hypothetical protein